MKNTFIVSVIGFASAGLLSAQGLYNIMPYDDEPEDSLPLEFAAGANIGWDSNAAPIFSECAGGDTDDALYLSGFVQANFVSKTPQTTVDLWGRLGATYYLDPIEQSVGPAGNRVIEDFYPQVRGGVNFVHRVNETLRLRSRNHITYEQEPDYDYGLATDRRQGSYFRYSSDNSVGYRWTERLGTNTGYRLSGVTFDEADRSDYVRHLFYHQFRYRTAPSTVWTAAYRYQHQDNDVVSDSNSHYFLVGAEHRVSPTTVVVLRGGVQVQEIDGGSSNTSPYLEARVKTAVTESTSVSAFVRYGLEDRNRWISTHDCGQFPVLGRYEERGTFRLGLQGSYRVSPKLSFYGGGNLILFSYDGQVGGNPAAPSSMDESIINVNGGAQYELYENIYISGSLNYTHSASDADIRDYERTRLQLGIQSSF